ncbi:MAG: hypothetical protein ACON4T_02395 [Synechococcus sp.]
MNVWVHWLQLIAGWSLPAFVRHRVLRRARRLGITVLFPAFAAGFSDQQVAAQLHNTGALSPPVQMAPPMQMAPPVQTMVEGAAPSASSADVLTIQSDTQSADNLTGVVTAIGNVRIAYPSRGMVATARQAQYFSRESRLVLSGDVDIIEKNGNALRAERVIYRLDQERAEAVPMAGQQVFSQMVIGGDRQAPIPLTP